MTIAIVQTKVTNAAWTGSFASNVTVSDTVFIYAYSYGPVNESSSNPTFGGSAVSNASKVLDGVGANGNSSVYSAIWMLPNLAGGAASYGLTNINGTVDANVGSVAIEVSGLGASPLLDAGAAPNPQTASGVMGAIGSGSTGNITTSPELIIGTAIGFALNLTPPGAPWTNGQASSFCSAGWQVVTSSGSSYAYNVTGSTGAAWIAGVAAIQVTLPVTSSPIPGDQMTNSGGDRGVAIRVFRSIGPGDVPAAGAQLPRLQGRAFLVPIPVDVEHAGHAWEMLAEPVPAGPGLLDVLADAGQAAAVRAGQVLRAAGPWTLDTTGQVFAAMELPRKPPQRYCGKVRRLGGTRLSCRRRPGHQGKHSDRGLDWR